MTTASALYLVYSDVTPVHKCHIMRVDLRGHKSTLSVAKQKKHDNISDRRRKTKKEQEKKGGGED